MNITCSYCHQDVSICQCPPEDWAKPLACPFTTVEVDGEVVGEVVPVLGGLAVNPPLQLIGKLPQSEAEWQAFQMRRAL